MKKILAFLLILAILLGFSACGTTQYEYPVNFYFLRHEDNILYSEPDGIITFETREAGRGDDLKYILNLYFQGPAAETLVTPFPSGLHVISLYTDLGTLELKLSDEFSKLTGIDLTLACACIAKTCLEFKGIEAVNLKVTDDNAEASRTIVLTKEAIQFFDDTNTSVVPQSE